MNDLEAMGHVKFDILGISLLDNGQGYRSLVNIGQHGGQEVPHLHFHLFGGEHIGKMVNK